MAGFRYLDGRWVEVDSTRSTGVGPDGQPTATLDAEPVPTGSAKEVVAWIGGRRDRARRALAFEQARSPGPRSTVEKAIAALLGDEASSVDSTEPATDDA